LSCVTRSHIAARLRRTEFSMSDTLTDADLRIDSPTEPTNAPPAVPTIGTTERVAASAPALASFPPTDVRVLHELVAAALAPEADETMRAGVRELWARLAESVATVQPIPTPSAPAIPAVMPTAPTMPAVPLMPTVSSPTSPIALATRALRQLPPDQLLDLVLQRLRAQLPAGTTVPEPKGIQFQLVPSLPPPRQR
jgi:hypothetical protein